MTRIPTDEQVVEEFYVERIGIRETRISEVEREIEIIERQRRDLLADFYILKLEIRQLNRQREAAIEAGD